MFLIQLQELEMENSKLRADLTNLRKTVADNVPGKSAEELMSKYLLNNLHLFIINIDF